MPRLTTLMIGTLVWTGLAGQSIANVMIVNRDTGRIAWQNASDDDLQVAAYTLRSASGGFRPLEWLSITDHYDADSGGTLDADSTWFFLDPNGPDSFNLSEGTFTTTAITSGSAVDLGAAWTPGHREDVTFEYLDAVLNEVLAGSVQFISDVPGDYNASGVVEQADLDLVLLNWGQPETPVPNGWINSLPSGTIDQAELDAVLLNWGAGGTVSAQPSWAGFFAANVPEPPAVAVAVAVVALPLCLARRRRSPPGDRTRAHAMRQCSSTASAVAT